MPRVKITNDLGVSGIKETLSFHREERQCHYKRERKLRDEERGQWFVESHVRYELTVINN